MGRFFLQLAVTLGVALAMPSLAAANPITDENALPGSSGWERSNAEAGKVEGYTSKVSVAAGETLGFNVSTKPAASFRVAIYRLGWYNGAGARQMTCLPGCSTSFTGSERSVPSPNSVTGEIDAAWPQTTSLTIPSNWTTGEYVAEYVLTSGSGNGTASYSPFVVRSSAPQASASDMLVVVPFDTYNAYNDWGGTSAYVNTTSGSFTLAHATKVSFNRPSYRRQWRYWDLPLLRFLEREGEDVSYVSDTDVDANPNIVQQHRAVIVSGHSEYWSKNMRDGFDAARDAGTNLMFMGANDAYWQVRYEDSSCADDNTVCGTVGDRRTMVTYKQEAANQTDPISNPSLKTIKWRDLGRPECELQGGVQYGSWFPNDGYRDYTTTAAGAGDPWAQGAGLSSGTIVKGLDGFEYDSFFPDCDPPGTPTILFQYQGPETSADIDAAAVRYTANGSGARVFSSGSEQWAWGLDSYRWDPTLFTGIPATNPAIQQFTRNMLADMARPAPPAGVSATVSGSTVQIDTTPRGDSRVTSYRVYRHAGSGSFQPGDAGVTLVCQNASGDCTDAPSAGTHRYASVAVDQWNDSSALLSGAVTIVSPVTAVNDSATVAEDTAATAIDVLANDTPSGVTKSITSRTEAGNGNVVITGGGTGLTYRPNADYCGGDTFTYTLNGGSTATVSVNVTCVDDPPVAMADSKTVTEDASATAIGVLSNDTDIDGGTKAINSVDTSGTHGSVVITGGGSGLTYKPNADYCNKPPGTNLDTFSYTLNGGDAATVSVTVNCVDDPPDAVDDSVAVGGNSGTNPLDIVSNDIDIDGGPQTIGAVSQPDHGTVQITGAGTGLTYTPDANYCGGDRFTYTLNGGSTAAVSVTVDCSAPPVAVNDVATVPLDSGPNLIDVLANDTDPDGGPKLIDLVTQPGGGTVAITQGGAAVTYAPHAGYCNSVPGMTLDGFSYTLNGGSTAAVSVVVICQAGGGVAGDSVTKSQPAVKKCKKSSRKPKRKAKAKCRKKKKKRAR